MNGALHGTARRRREAGFSLIEILVAMVVTSLIGGGLLSLLLTTQEAEVTLGERSDTERSGQLGIGWIQRDLRRAGIGYNDLIAPVPLIEPRDDGGVEIRSNPSGEIRMLQMHMVRGGTQIHLDEPGDFQVGDKITIYDSSGAFQTLTITAVLGGGRQLRTAEAARTTYRHDRGGAVSAMEQIAYFVDDSGVTPTLMRQVNEDPAAPLAVDVSRLEFTYFDDSVPSVAFTPDTAGAQLRIRSVAVTLWMDRQERLLGIGSTPAVRLTARVFPRAIGLVR